MPRKTRRQKLAALERKKRFLHEHSFSTDAPGPIKAGKELPPHKPATADQSENDRKKSFLVNDIKKSFFIIMIIIALEILVYFGTMNNYLKF